MRKFRQMALILLMVFSMGAAIGEPQVDEKTIAYLKSAEFQKKLYSLGLYWDRNVLEIETECMSKYQLLPLSLSILSPLIFDETSDIPVAGSWTVRYRFERCDKAIVYNALALAKEGKVTVMRLVPGYTRASPVLLRDLLVGAIPVSLGLGDNSNEAVKCDDIKVLNTEVTIAPELMRIRGELQSGVWEEQWLVKSCEKEIGLNFCFVPTPDGGTDWSHGNCSSIKNG